MSYTPPKDKSLYNQKLYDFDPLMNVGDLVEYVDDVEDMEEEYGNDDDNDYYAG